MNNIDENSFILFTYSRKYSVINQICDIDRSYINTETLQTKCYINHTA